MDGNYLVISGVPLRLVSHRGTAQCVVGYQRCPDWMCLGREVNWKTGYLRSQKIIKAAQAPSFSRGSFIKSIRKFYLEHKTVLWFFWRGLESSISWNIRNFFRVDFFIFWARKGPSWCFIILGLEVPFPEI